MCAPSVGNPLVELAADLFGLSDIPALITAPLDDACMVVMRLAGDVPPEGRVIELPAVDTYLLQLYLVDVRHCDLLPGGEATPVRLFPQGSLCLVDLAEGMAIRLHSAYDMLAFHIPHALLADQAAAARMPAVHGLETCRAAEDPVVRHLGAALLPLFEAALPGDAEALAHVARGLALHLAHRYARVTVTTADDIALFLRQGVERGIALDALAMAVEFMPAGFAEVFAASHGLEPLPWLRRQALDKARRLLETTGDSIAVIASACGFADSGEFRRVFGADCGQSPSAWRRRVQA